MLLPGSCPPVPSCPSALLPHAQTLPSSSSARLAAMQATVRQRLPTEVQGQDTRERLFKDGDIWCDSSCGDCVSIIAASWQCPEKQGIEIQSRVRAHLCFSPADRDDTNFSLGRLTDSQTSMLCCVCACSLQLSVCRPSDAAKLSHPAAICLSSRLRGRGIMPAFIRTKCFQLEHTEGIKMLRGA